MTFRKILLPALAATLLSGCIYEDVAYEQPRRVYHSGYGPRGVVVVDQAPGRYYNQRNNYPYYVNGSRGYYQQVPQRGYYNRPYANQVYVDHRHHDHHGETWQERQRRELREAQRAREKKNDDKKKKKKKKDD